MSPTVNPIQDQPSGPAIAGPSLEEFPFTARDGLTLLARRYRPARAATGLRPVLCLAGLTRNGRDFDVIARALASGEAARTIYTLDMRGRGGSAWDKDWRNYSFLVEMLDVQDFMTAHDLTGGAIIGTSRGGLISFALGVLQPSAIGAIVLNDIGPVIEPTGLRRIASYVGRIPTPLSWADAARITADMGRANFPKLTDAEWDRIARQWFNDKDGRPAPGFDPQIGKAITTPQGPIPPLWQQFQALSHAPCLIVRGALSDLLSAATVGEMLRRHPRAEAITVPDQGHAPLLKDEATIGAIRTFLDDADAGRVAAGRHREMPASN